MKSHTSAEYDQEIKGFINLACRDELENDKIMCHCKCCGFKIPRVEG